MYENGVYYVVSREREEEYGGDRVLIRKGFLLCDILLMWIVEGKLKLKGKSLGVWRVK